MGGRREGGERSAAGAGSHSSDEPCAWHEWMDVTWKQGGRESHAMADLPIDLERGKPCKAALTQYVFVREELVCEDDQSVTKSAACNVEIFWRIHF